MKDKHGNELHINDEILAKFGENCQKCYVYTIVKSKTGNSDIAFVKFEFAKNGGFGSCMIYPKSSSEIELLTNHK